MVFDSPSFRFVLRSGRMPLSFEEIDRWSVDDVNGQILKLLPKGWSFDMQTLPEHWRAAYKSEAGVEVWADTHYALRILLLNAFAWLWQRLNPSRVHPAWRPVDPPTLVAVRRIATQTPDPADLDPKHVQSVYAALARKREKETG